jgi:alginate O-acetyltransferase complex protein AlgI
VSYFSFRAIHVIVESYKRSITELEPLAFFTYMVFFPAFVSGPINRFPHFAAQLAAGGRSPWQQDFAQGGRRIVDGLFKKFVLVTLVFPHVLPTQPAALAAMTPIGALVGLWAYALYFYFDFSGYSDLAIGSARLMGVELPENFNRPFLQKNIRDVWTNWHMSLTSWLVDYVYWPVVRQLRNLEFFRPRPVLLSIVGMNVTFVACGMWHGESLHFVAWGAYHGLGISVLNLYQRWKRQLRHPEVQRYFASSLSRWAGALVTFHFFAFGLALFVLDLERLGVLAAALLR